MKCRECRLVACARGVQHAPKKKVFLVLPTGLFRPGLNPMLPQLTVL